MHACMMHAGTHAFRVCGSKDRLSAEHLIDLAASGTWSHYRGTPLRVVRLLKYGDLWKADMETSGMVDEKLRPSSKHVPWRLNYSKKKSIRITTRLVLLLMLGIVRLAVFSIEQPASTLMTCFPYIRFLEKLVGHLPCTTWMECRLHLVSFLFAIIILNLSPMGAYGHSHHKPSLLFGTASGSQILQILACCEALASKAAQATEREGQEAHRESGQGQEVGTGLCESQGCAPSVRGL